MPVPQLDDGRALADLRDEMQLSIASIAPFIESTIKVARSASLRLVLSSAVAVLTGCASLPSNPVREQSTAISDYGSTRLGAIATASISNPKLSGFQLLPLAWSAYESRIKLAGLAQRSLDVQYYVLHADATGNGILRALRDAATRGVRVRLLVDDLYAAGEDEVFAALASSPNVEVRLFNPFASGRASMLGRFAGSLGGIDRVDHRMHNKLFVADNAVAIAGGRNIADEYFMRSADNNFVDLDVLAAGPIVRELSSGFDRYWNSEYVFPIESLASIPGSAADLRTRFDALTSTAPLEPDIGVPARLQRYTTTVSQLEDGKLKLTQALAYAYVDPPNKAAGSKDLTREGTVRESVVSAMRTATQEVFVASPYFVPGDVGLATMRALRERGVHLILLTNSLAATDEPLVHTGYMRYRIPMLRSGVDIFELSPGIARERARLGRFGTSKARLHAKIAVIDHRTLFVGSMNFDNRSEHRNTELGMLIDSPALSEELLTMMDFQSSAYRLRLALDGHSPEWVEHTNTGDVVFAEEPETSPWLRLEVFLLSPFVPEGEL